MVYAVDVLGFSIMDHYFYLLVEMSPGGLLSDDEVRRRFILLYKKGDRIFRRADDVFRGAVFQSVALCEGHDM